MAIATIGRWGKTLAVRLPKELTSSARLNNGDVVELEQIEGEVRLRKRRAIPNIEELFAGASSEEWRAAYRGAYDWGDDVGRENVRE